MVYEYKGKKYIPLAYDSESHKLCSATCAFGGNDDDSQEGCRHAPCCSDGMQGYVFTEQTEDNQDAC